MPGVSWRIPSIPALSATVRCSEAASGSEAPAYRYPWSSSGRNPPGRRPLSTTVKAMKPPSTSSATTDLRTRNRQVPT